MEHDCDISGVPGKELNIQINTIEITQILIDK